MSLLDTRIPAGLDENGMDPDERRQYETLRAHRALGLIVQRVPLDIPMWRWAICSGIVHNTDNTLGIDAHLGDMPNDHASRASIMKLAEQLGLDFTEKPHLNGKNIVSARGRYAEVPVKIWTLVSPCTCGCGVA